VSLHFSFVAPLFASFLATTGTKHGAHLKKGKSGYQCVILFLFAATFFICSNFFYVQQLFLFAATFFICSNYFYLRQLFYLQQLFLFAATFFYLQQHRFLFAGTFFVCIGCSI